MSGLSSDLAEARKMRFATTKGAAVLEKKIPMRQCLGCREMKPKRELVRVVRSPAGEISLDFRGKAPGRGAYVCRNAQWWRMREKTLKFLGLMRRANALQVGENNAGEAVRAGKAKLLLLSADVADNARRKAENVTNGRRVLVLPVRYTRAELGSAFGLGECSMAAITDLGFADAFAKTLAEAEPERFGETAAELARRNEKAARRKSETQKRADSKRNGKRRTEV